MFKAKLLTRAHDDNHVIFTMVMITFGCILVSGDDNYGDMYSADDIHGGDMQHGDNHGNIYCGDDNHGVVIADNHGDENRGDMYCGDNNHGDVYRGDDNPTCEGTVSPFSSLKVGIF